MFNLKICAIGIALIAVSVTKLIPDPSYDPDIYKTFYVFTDDSLRSQNSPFDVAIIPVYHQSSPFDTIGFAGGNRGVYDLSGIGNHCIYWESVKNTDLRTWLEDINLSEIPQIELEEDE